MPSRRGLLNRRPGYVRFLILIIHKVSTGRSETNNPPPWTEKDIYKITDFLICDLPAEICQ